MPTHWFEQPTDEAARICLRLDSLFDRFDQSVQDESHHGCYTAISVLSQLMSAVDRSDLSSKLHSLSSAQRKRLQEFENSPAVDRNKLNQLLQSIHADNLLLKKTQAKPGDSLRQNPLFNTLKQHINSPNGLSEFNVPQFHLWMKQPRSHRSSCLKEWADEFQTLKRVIKRNLDLMRSNAQTQQTQTERGLFQQSLDPSNACHLLRVKLDTPDPIYPTISVGKHQVNIQLYNLSSSLDGISQKCHANIPLTIQYCRS